MPTSVIPYIPETIVVHLGAPTASAANVTVPFTDYVKNVVSSEIYPTWEPAALEANTLAIISFALNRYYTEYYRSRGYNFDITSSTAIDQKYICLNLSQFNPVPHVFNLIIFTGHKDQFSFCISFSNITCTVNQLRIIRIQGILDKCFFRLFLISIISMSKTGSPNTDFSFLPLHSL